MNTESVRLQILGMVASEMPERLDEVKEKSDVLMGKLKSFLEEGSDEDKAVNIFAFNLFLIEMNIYIEKM